MGSSASFSDIVVFATRFTPRLEIHFRLYRSLSPSRAWNRLREGTNWILDHGVPSTGRPGSTERAYTQAPAGWDDTNWNLKLILADYYPRFSGAVQFSRSPRPAATPHRRRNYARVSNINGNCQRKLNAITRNFSGYPSRTDIFSSSGFKRVMVGRFLFFVFCFANSRRFTWMFSMRFSVDSGISELSPKAWTVTPLWSDFIGELRNRWKVYCKDRLELSFDLFGITIIFLFMSDGNTFQKSI